MTASVYASLPREELEARLRAAEDVCVMYAWSPAGPGGSDREKALAMVWRHWYDMVGAKFVEPEAQPHLSDERIAELARERDEIRANMQWALDRLIVVEPSTPGGGS